MTSIRDVSDETTWGPALDEAVNTIGRGGLIVLPTDTVYGIGADAFDGRAVAGLLAAKGRGRQMPPPVLIGSPEVMDALAEDVTDDVRALVAKHWPGPLTIICYSQPSLSWDLGDTHGTVALRMPDHPAALALLRRTGPLAVSSANVTGGQAAQTAQSASDQLGESVAVYLDAGTSPLGVASTIVDATGTTLRIVREGGLSHADLARTVPSIKALGDDAADPASDAAADGAEADAASATGDDAGGDASE